MAQAPAPAGVRARAAVLDGLLSAWREAGGREPCGLLLGRESRRVLEIERLLPLPNVHEMPDRAFRLAPEDVAAAIASAASEPVHVVGAWHGHLTGPAWPGQSDRESMDASRAVTDALARPRWIHVIVGVGARDRPVIRAFLIVGRRVEPVRLRIAR